MRAFPATYLPTLALVGIEAVPSERPEKSWSVQTIGFLSRNERSDRFPLLKWRLWKWETSAACIYGLERMFAALYEKTHLGSDQVDGSLHCVGLSASRKPQLWKLDCASVGPRTGHRTAFRDQEV